MATKLILFSAVVAIATVSRVTTSGHCAPGSSCWPTYQQFADFAASLDGDAIFPFDSNYTKAVHMHNTRTTRAPYVVAMAMTVGDVQKAVLFARRHTMKISVYSAGNDYIGRSTADNSIQEVYMIFTDLRKVMFTDAEGGGEHHFSRINLSNMKKLTFNLTSSRNPAGEMVAESGNTMIRVYTEVDKINRVAVGGAADTVSMAGYTLGGGHAPIGRKYGLAADNLLEVELVTADGSIVVANDQMTRTTDRNGGTRTSQNTDLFWAIRGGGGGTYGIVTTFTFNIHFPPKSWVMVSCQYPMYIGIMMFGENFLKSINDMLNDNSLAPEWGGYEFTSGSTMPSVPNSNGTIYVAMNHAGEWGSPSFNTIQPFLSLYGPSYCRMTNVTTFLEYWKASGASGDFSYISYVFNTLMQPGNFTHSFYSWMFDRGIQNGVSCTSTLLGGSIRNVSSVSNAMNPYFRSADTSLSCFYSWRSPTEEDQHVRAAESFSTQLLGFGVGAYLNEASAYLPNWKIDYWGSQSNYDKLLLIKMVWDPHNVFTCHHCVGSDLGSGGIGGGLVG